MEFFTALRMYPKTAIRVSIIKNYIKLSNYFVDNYCKLCVRIGYENNKLFIIPTDNDDVLGHKIIKRKKESYGYIYCRSFLKKYNIDPCVFSSHWDPKNKHLIITLKDKKAIQFSDSNI